MITIAIPFYRGVNYLQRAVDSVLAQSASDWNLLIVDDCGPDQGAEELVRSYHDPRITYVRNPENLGMAGNWNRCLSLSQTDLVTLLHADDELLPNYVRLMSQAAANDSESAAFFCGARIIDAEGRKTFSFPDFVKGFINPARVATTAFSGEQAITAMLRGNFIMCPTLCYRKSKLGNHRFRTDLKQVHDMELTTSLLLAGAVITGLREVAYSYRRHGENATTTQNQSLLRFEEEVALYDRLERAARAKVWTRAAALARRKTIIRLNLIFCIVQDVLRLEIAAARRKLAFLTMLG